MARTVSSGESILPHLTAETWNRLIRQVRGTGVPGHQDFDHQNILHGSYSGSNPISAYDPVGLNDDSAQEKPHLIKPLLTDSINEHNWVIPTTRLSPGRSGDVVVWGVTKANVTILHPWHKYVNYFNGQLVSANWGKASLVVPGEEFQESTTEEVSSENRASLICIGQRVPAQGIAYASSSFSARTGATLPSQSCKLVEIDENAEFLDTDQPIVLHNMAPTAAQGGYVQFKEWAGRYILDFAPCMDEVEEPVGGGFS